ncbi:MAG: NAD(P)/FAD-dependent oxidoreductase [Tissierellia bacterium]|nr:NAD(P)/FAD-dependent oxidoreductase [Tissierellia bacterium]
MAKTLVIGGGSSGLFAAILLARQGHNVQILERNDRPGRKLLATGNGRCNFSNRNIEINRFHSENPKFPLSAIHRFNVDDAVCFFEELGIEVLEQSQGRLYPRSLQSKAVLDAMLLELRHLQVDLILNTKVTKISKGDNWRVETEEGKDYTGEILLIATGGVTLPKSGSDGLGYELVRDLGHPITPIHPAIVQLRLQGIRPGHLNGVRFFAKLKLFSEGKLIHEDYDEILFADYGFSGPAVLQLSGYALREQRQARAVHFEIDLFPELTIEEMRVNLSYRFGITGYKSAQETLVGLIHDKLIPSILEEAGVDPEVKTASLQEKQIHQLARALKGWTHRLESYKSLEEGQVTVGGVSTDLINPSTMESKLHPGLYFVGEVMDVDGDCGGFNLQWAWSSAYAAAMSIQ